MPEIPDVIPGEPILSGEWGNPIRSRTLQRYASAAERDALVPLPDSGDAAWLEDTGTLTVYDGTGWLEIIDSSGGQTINGGFRVTGSPQFGDPAARRFMTLDGGGSGLSAAHSNIVNNGSPNVRGVGHFFVDTSPSTPDTEAFWFVGQPYQAAGRYRIAFKIGDGSAALAAAGDMRAPTVVGVDVLRDGTVITPNTLLVGHVGELPAASVLSDGETYTDVSDALAELASRLEAIETALGL